MKEEKCKECIFYEEEFECCIAPVCVEEYDYDPETRIYTPKVIKNET